MPFPVFLLFNLCAELLFFDEFGTRYNFIAVDYLVYTKEVVGNIWESYNVNIIIFTIFITTALFFFITKKRLLIALQSNRSYSKRQAFFLVLPILSFYIFNEKFTESFKNEYINELSKNGIYALFSAFRNNKLSYDKFYVTKDKAFIYKKLRELLKEDNSNFLNSDLMDITRTVKNGMEKKTNLIIVVEESLSASFLRYFGNKNNITPNLDNLVEKSLFFTNLYATGTRTVRGLEAIELATPPVPGNAVVRRRNNPDFYGLGSILKEKGYDTKFIYGGFGYFDNMNDFFIKSGFDIIDRSNFDKDEMIFSNIWGVCDEALFNKAVKEANKSYQFRKPFLHVIMTTSNHRPYTFPDGRIDLPSKKSKRNGAVKYADYAIGKFIRDSEKEPWFDDTIFVFIADHCASSSGKSVLAIKEFHIPMFIYSPKHIKPAIVSKLMSQIDAIPTVFGLMKVNYKTRFYGRDILKDNSSKERAFISTYERLGYLTKNRLVILEPKKRILCFDIDSKTEEYKGECKDKDIADEAITYYQTAFALHEKAFFKR